MNKIQMLRFARNYPFDDRELHWRWFGALKFPDSPSLQNADRLLQLWRGELQDFEGLDSLNFIYIMECSCVGIRFHVVAGGKKISDKWRWVLRWHELGGIGSLHYCCRPQIVLDHLAKTCYPDSEFDYYDSLGGIGWYVPDHLFAGVMTRGCCIGAMPVCQKWSRNSSKKS
jgi:hypothetical protein